MESPAVLRPCRRLKLARSVKDKEHLHVRSPRPVLAVIDLRIIPDLVL
jgi:hypothetical protein